MRSFQEMASIVGLSTLVYDAQGHPNDVWKAITRGATLYRVRKLNVNSVQPAALQAMGWDNPQIATLQTALESPSLLNPSGRLTMPSLPSLDGISDSVFGTQIEVLTIHVQVKSGQASFQLQTTIAVPGKASSDEPDTLKEVQSPIHYPFKILEFNEEPEEAPSGSISKEEQ
jgi:hypothetical protein